MPDPSFRVLDDSPGNSRYGASYGVASGRAFVGLGLNGEIAHTDWYEMDFKLRKLFPRGNFPGTARGLSMCAATAKGVYAIGGGNFVGAVNAENWVYVVSGNYWVQRTNFTGAARMKGAAACNLAGTKIYCGLGVDAALTYYADWFEYTEATDAWANKTAFPGTAREGAYSFIIGNKVYVGGGNNGVTYYTDMYEYDMGTDTWTAKTGIGSAASGGSGFSVDGKGYVIGGTRRAFGQTFTVPNVWEYDPTGNTWTARTNFPNSTTYYNAPLSVGGKSFILGGKIVAVGTTYPAVTDLYSNQVLCYFLDIGLRIQTQDGIITPVCEPSESLISPLRFAKNSKVYGVALINPLTEFSSKIYVKTTSDQLKTIEKIPEAD